MPSSAEIITVDLFSLHQRSTPDSVETDDLQMRLSGDDSGTEVATPVISVKQEMMGNDIPSDEELPDDEEDPHRLRIKESATDDTVFDGGGIEESPNAKEAAREEKSPAPVVVKSETPSASGTPSVTSTEQSAPASTTNSTSATIRPWSNGVVHPVRPDVIFSHRRASKSPPVEEQQPAKTTNGTAVSRVPSVILGQSGGVKTMVWTGHWADQQQQQQQQSPSRPRSLPPGSAESSPNRKNVPAGPGRLMLDNNDPSIRLSVDGLLSLAQAHASSSPPSRQSANRSSPPHVILPHF